MSKLGKKVIKIPEKVSIEKISDDLLKIKGPLGEADYKLPEGFLIEIKENEIYVRPKDIKDPNRVNKKIKRMWGTARALLNNKILSTFQEFEKVLILQGLGYNAEVVGDEIRFKLGFSHPVIVKIPEGIKVKIESLKNQFRIILSGKDKERVGEFSAFIRKLKVRDVYKVKGFRYEDEFVKVKPVKKTVGK
jgi:large subunit ribosomal protein L6